MRLLLFTVLIFSLALLFFTFKKDKNLSKLFVGLGSFALIIALAITGNITRPIVPLFLAHVFLLMVSWFSVVWYLLRGHYYWWIVCSPLLTIALFFILEHFFGQSGELL